LALRVIEADQLGEHTLGVDPAQGMQEHVELTGIVTNDGKIAIETMLKHRA